MLKTGTYTIWIDYDGYMSVSIPYSAKVDYGKLGGLYAVIPFNGTQLWHTLVMLF